MNGLNAVYPTSRHNEYSPLKRMEKANVVLFAYSDGTIEITKNRYGETGMIGNGEGIELLINLLSRTVFNDTCIIFQESLKKMIYKEIGGYKVSEGEKNDKI